MLPMLVVRLSGVFLSTTLLCSRCLRLYIKARKTSDVKSTAPTIDTAMAMVISATEKVVVP